MLTETQKRALRAQALLDSGMDAKEAARECGYKNVNGMMGAIALSLRKLPDEDRETELERMREKEKAPAFLGKRINIPKEDDRADLPAGYDRPGYYRMDEGLVIVGERIDPQAEAERRARKEAEKEEKRRRAQEKYAATMTKGKGGVCTWTKRCRVELGENEDGETVLKVHVYGVDKWLQIEEETVGGRHELLRIARDMRAGLDAVTACGEEAASW